MTVSWANYKCVFAVASVEYFLYSHCLCEPSLKASCANIHRATVKVEVALSSLVNGLQGPLSRKNATATFKGRKSQLSEKMAKLGKNCPKKPKIGLKSIFVLVKVGPTWITTAYQNSGC